MVAENIEKKHAYLDKKDLPPKIVPVRDLIAEAYRIESDLHKKGYVINVLYNYIDEIDANMKRLEKRHQQSTIYSKELLKTETELDNKIINLRKKRKEVTMTILHKKGMCDILKKALNGLMSIYEKIESSPTLMSSVELAEETAERSTSVTEKIKRRISKFDNMTQDKQKEEEESGEPEGKAEQAKAIK